MNRKQLNKFLIVGVALLWLLIGVRIVSVILGPSKTGRMLKAEQTLRIEDETDTITLYLNYRDPFMSLRTSIAAERSGGNLQPQTSSVPVVNNAQSVNWPQVSFNGTIYSMDRSSGLALVKITGKPFLMRQGDVADGIILRVLETDSIVLEFSNILKTFK